MRRKGQKMMIARDAPNRRVYHLAHQRCAILQEGIENLRLYREPARAGPLGVFGLKLSIKLRGLDGGRHGMEVGRMGVGGRRGAV